MRKILSLVLVLSLVFGSFGFAFAVPKDVVGTDYEDAVQRLSALEILAGFPDGTFRPNETVTRAQCAKIMVHALGVGDAANYASGETKFADVPASHWAAGYINVATDMKIINGYGNGNFGPEDKVTYAQAVTMIVRALGFEPKAQAIGGYPGGYIAIAAEEDITDDINVVNTLAATRGDVALMVDNALTVPMMYQKTWGQFPEYANDDEDKTLMKTKLGVDEISGVVTAIPNTDSALDEDQIRVKDDDETEKYDLLVDDMNLDSLLGLEVTVWADGNDILDYDIDTDEDEILFDTIDKDSKKDEISLYIEDDTFEWASDAKAYVNFEEVDLDEVPEKAYGYLVLNEKEEVAFANVFDFDEVAVGAVYDVDGDVLSYVEPDAKTDEIELSDYDDGVFIYNEKMELVDTDEIDVDSAIFAWETSDELYLMVKNEAAKGELERIKDKEVRIDGETYDKAKDGAVYSDDKLDSFDEYIDIESLDNLGGEEVTAVLDLNSEILFIYGDTEATSSTMYGVVTYAELGSKAEATVFTGEGEEVDYVFEDRADAKGIEQGNSTNDIDYFEKSGDGLVFSVMKFKLDKDGEIDSDYITDPDADENRIDIIDFTRTTELLKDDDKSYVWIDEDGDDDTNDRTKYYISEDTVFMTALDSDGYLDPEVLDYEDIYESKIVMDDNGTDTLVCVYGEPGKDADFILFLDKSFTGFDDEYYYGVVTDSPWYDGGDYVATIDVFGEGEDEYVVANEEHFTEGKVVMFHYNIDGEIVRDDVGNKDNDGNFDYDDGYLTNTDDETVKISSKAVVYELDSDGDVDDTVSVSKVDDSRYETLIYILNEDEMVVAATVVEKTEETSDSTETEADGEIAYVDYDSSTDTTIRINVDGINKSYNVDPSNVVVLDKDDNVITGNILTVGTKVNFIFTEGTTEIDIIKAVDMDITVPRTPVNFTATDDAGANTISLSWADQSSDNDLHHFEIYYKIGSVADAGDNVVSTNVARTVTSESFDAGVASLNDGDRVYFAIYAVDAAGNKVKADDNVIYHSSETYTIDVSESGTYTFPTQIIGYSSAPSQNVTITKTGTGDITNLAVTKSGTDADNFTLGGLGSTTLNDSTTSTNFIVKPDMGLAEGTYTATIIITANNSISEAFNVSFTVSPANTAPQANNQTANGTEGVLYTLDLETIFTDDRDVPSALTYAVKNDNGAATAVLNTDGKTVEYTPVAGDVGKVVVIIVTATDTDGAMSNDVTITLAVNAANTAPEADNQTANATEGVKYTLDLEIIFTDDRDVASALTYAVKNDNGAATAVLNIDGKTVEYTPAAGDVGNNVVITVTATDTDGATSNDVTITIAVSAANKAPEANNQTANGTEGVQYILDLETIFTDDRDVPSALTYAVKNDDGEAIAALNIDGKTVEYTPTAGDVGNNVVITVTATDTDGAISNDVTITLTVNTANTANTAPKADNQTANVTVGVKYKLNLETIFTDDRDVPSALTYAVKNDTGEATAILRRDDKTVKYTPVAGDVGKVVVITVTATDTEGATSNDVTITLTVN